MHLLSQANEILLGGKKLTAVEACDRGLVTAVFPQADFSEKIKEVLTHMGSMPPMVGFLCIGGWERCPAFMPTPNWQLR